MNLIGKIKKNFTPQWVFFFFVVLIFKLLFYFRIYHFIPQFGEDSYTYMAAAQKLVHFQIDEYRTPGFPIYLGVLKLIFAKYFAHSVVFANIIISCISYFFVQKIIYKFCTKRYLFVFFVIIDLIIFNYDYFILTESLCKSLVIYLIYLYLNNRSTIYIQLILILIKPIFLILFIFNILEIVILKNYTKIIHQVLILILLVGYSLIFKSNFGYWGISKVNDYNKFSQLIHFKLYENNDFQLFSKKMNQYYLDKSNTKSIENFETIGLNKVFKDSVSYKYAYANLHLYIKYTMEKQEYIFLSLQLRKFIFNINKEKLINIYPFNIKIFSFGYTLIFLLLLSLFLLLRFYLLKLNDDFVEKMALFFLLFFLMTMAIVFWGTGNEYSRLLMPFSPFLFITFILIFDKFSISNLNSPNQP